MTERYKEYKLKQRQEYMIESAAMVRRVCLEKVNFQQLEDFDLIGGYGFVLGRGGKEKEFYYFRVKQISAKQGELYDFVSVSQELIPMGVLVVPFSKKRGVIMNFSTFIKDLVVLQAIAEVWEYRHTMVVQAKKEDKKSLERLTSKILSFGRE